MTFDIKRGWRETTEIYFFRRARKNIFTSVLFITVGCFFGLWKYYKSDLSSTIAITDDVFLCLIFLVIPIIPLSISTLEYYNIIKINKKLNIKLLTQANMSIDSVLSGAYIVIGYSIVNFFISFDYSNVIWAALGVFYSEVIFKIRDHIDQKIAEVEAFMFAESNTPVDEGMGINTIFNFIKSAMLAGIFILLSILCLKVDRMMQATEAMNINIKYLADIFVQTPRQVKALYQELTPVGQLERYREDKKSTQPPEQKFPPEMPDPKFPWPPSPAK